MRLVRGVVDQGLQIQIPWPPNETYIDHMCQAKALALHATESRDLQCAPTQMVHETQR